MDKAKVSKYFSALNDGMMMNGLHAKPESIWNMDETGLQLDVRPRKVVVRKAQKTSIVKQVETESQSLLLHV